MTGKITAAVAVALLLAAANVASARPIGHANTGTALQSSFADSYYNKGYWDAWGPRLGAPIQQRDPFVGTPFENFVPY
jgi:hypothetical protein